MSVCWKIGSDSEYTAKGNEACPIGYVQYDGEIIPDGEYDVLMIWDDALGLPRPLTEVELKARAAVIKIEEIYKEQEMRSVTLLEFPMPRQGFALIEEFYLQVLLPAARKNITEADSPILWGLRELRNNRNTLLAGLQVWIDNPGKTAADILAFDVANWSGWTIDRP